ncbi:MAG: hypothetical protein KKB20_19755 [Proteobacteria bacterium]|nr:hypothetical protein [Pseudomonadota bacterium]
MEHKQEMEALLSDFEEMLRQVSEDVGKAAVLPAVREVQDEWSARMSELLRRLESIRESAEAVRDGLHEAQAHMEAVRSAVKTESERVIGDTRRSFDELAQKTAALAAEIDGKTNLVREMIGDLKSLAAGIQSAVGLVADRIKQAGDTLEQTANHFKRTWRESELRVDSTMRRAAAEFDEHCRQAQVHLEGRHQQTLERVQKAEQELTSILTRTVTAKQTFGEQMAAFGQEMSTRLDETRKTVDDGITHFQRVRRSIIIGFVLTILLQSAVAGLIVFLLMKG